MTSTSITTLAIELLIILAAGLVAGAICKRIGVSMLVGYLVIGALIGQGALGFLTGESHDREYLAEAGALLLLFSIGLEFSPRELVHLSRFVLLGGSVQMLLVAGPTMGVCILLGVESKTAVLIGAAVALSSTVLVFKSLEEWGQANSRHGRRAIGVLLFQDVAIVPLMLLVPMLTGSSETPGATAWVVLALKSVGFVSAVLLIQMAIQRWGVGLLRSLGSVELVVLAVLVVLGGTCLAAQAIGLPPSLGALAAGVMLSGNRLSGQIDALMLPFRETFAAVFFVGLGSLMRFDLLLDAPGAALGGLIGVLALKTVAAAVALRLVGLRWRAAWGMGLGLAQLGELSFILLLEGSNCQPPVIDAETYNYVLFLALGTLILTPQLIKLGLGWAARADGREKEATLEKRGIEKEPVPRAVIVGSGPIGGRVASHLETTGMDVCMVELNPVNLHRFAQQGFRTVAGDATEPEILGHAGIEQSALAVITVPDDDVALRVVASIRRLNASCTILVRCRFQSRLPAFERAGAHAVVSEETEVAGSLLRLLAQRRPQDSALPAK
ncbi:MAG: cation:proton antiporter [Pirellulales bacterium]|nr:cation:proton antiporter [Pirellulales bacterium]